MSRPAACASFALSVFACCWIACTAETDAGEGELPAEEFLRAVRQPFRRELWARFEGSIQHVAGSARSRGAVRLALVFSGAGVEAQVVLNGLNVYRVTQSYGGADPSRLTLRVPREEVGTSLSDLGIAPEDVTLAFIYWPYEQELPRQEFRRQECRVMDLRHPHGEGGVHVWFTAREGFPLRVDWVRTGQTTPWRTLEMKGARRVSEDFWFVREMRLEGDGWKTQVKFDDGDVHETRVTPVPDDLFDDALFTGDGNDLIVRPRAPGGNSGRTGTGGGQ